MIQSGNLYADLSGYYDLFCAEVDYAAQCAFAKRAYDCFANSGGHHYLDLACGTGAHILPMQSYGFVATGLDNSADMLAQAVRRCPNAEFILSDMSALEASCHYDLISCFLYSIHYSHPVSSLKLTLKRTFDALKPGGVFIFNTVDITGINSRHFVSTRVETEHSIMSFTSGWTYCGAGEAMHLHLSINQQVKADSAQSSEKRVWQDKHTMTAISIHGLKQWLQETGFEVTLLEHDYSRLQAWAGESFNIIVVAGKPL
ncbi:MAG: methyltransferase domain-containing protein [Pseudohongiella sp.]|nr:methyltransferase domain-containing protein [Pseudohongiella sp.]MDO9519458.1 methyltransferase domain-containing protein [Pseudohongiella sp.]MDP2127534.1 methyltransferase domain-containing protein [Pseudohongiella sp.]